MMMKGCGVQAVSRDWKVFVLCSESMICSLKVWSSGEGKEGYRSVS